MPESNLLFASEKLSISLARRTQPFTQPVYFSDQKREITLILTGMDRCINISATLFQLTTRLSAEISEQQLVNCESFAKNLDALPTPLEFSFQTPKIRQESRFKWEFNTCNGGNACQSIGEFIFTVVPSNLIEPIKQWSKDHTLYAHDKSGVLQNFLDKSAIKYIENKNLLPKNEALISLIVVDAEDINIDKLLPTNKSGAVILFREYPAEYPTIIDKTNRQYPLLDVHIPLIGKLENNPAAQKLFLKLFYMLPQS